MIKLLVLIFLNLTTLARGHVIEFSLRAPKQINSYMNERDQCERSECQTAQIIGVNGKLNIYFSGLNTPIQIHPLSADLQTFAWAAAPECYYPGCFELIGTSGYLSSNEDKILLVVRFQYFRIDEDRVEPLFFDTTHRMSCATSATKEGLTCINS